MFRLVTEEEVRHGLLAPNDVTSSALCFVRNIEDMSEHLHESKAWRFIDKSDDDVDDEAQKMLTQLRDAEIPRKLPQSNILKYDRNVPFCINLIFLELGFQYYSYKLFLGFQ